MYLFCHTWDTDCRLWHGLDTLCIQNCSIILKGLPQKKKKFRCHANIATSAVNSVIVGNPIKKIHKVLTLEKYVETENVKRLQSMRWTKNISFDTTKKKTEQTYSIKVVYYK